MRLPGEFQDAGGTESARTCGWFLTTRVYLALQDLPTPAQWLERTNTTPNPPAPQKSGTKTQKRRRRHQNALRRFLATLAMIGRDYAPDFDGANPQGVQWDSLGSFKTLGAQEVLEHAGGQKPPVCILSSKAPQPQRSAWNGQRRPQTPPCCRKPAHKRKSAAGIAITRFGASWQCRR
jgi:hypothetical protein